MDPNQKKKWKVENGRHGCCGKAQFVYWYIIYMCVCGFGRNFWWCILWIFKVSFSLDILTSETLLLIYTYVLQLIKNLNSILFPEVENAWMENPWSIKILHFLLQMQIHCLLLHLLHKVTFVNLVESLCLDLIYTVPKKLQG